MVPSRLKKVIDDNGLTGTDDDIKTALEAESVDVVKNIQVVDIKRYLILKGKLPSIRESNELACKLVIEAFDTFDEFNMSDPVNVAALNQQMDGLVAAGIIDNGDKNFVLALGEGKSSYLTINGLGRVTIGDIQKARAL